MANKRLDFDLDFLDKKEVKNQNNRVDHKSKSYAGNTTEHKGNSGDNNWKTILIVLGVIFGFIFLVFGSSSNDSVNDDTVAVGDYLCSSAIALQADNISPDDTIFEELETELSNLEYDSSLLDEYDQFAVDDYNARVDAYNIKKDEYNYNVERYNTFLIENCTKNN